VLNDILGQKECTGIRFYNAVYPEGSAESILSIGVNAEKQEIYSIVSAKSKYQLFERIEEGRASIEPTSKDRARGGCQVLGASSFNVDFSKTDIEGLLGLEGATGIEIMKSTSASGESTMTIRAAKIINGSISPIEGTTEIACGEPCPNLCGGTVDYLYVHGSE
jgi:hypothetical protein